METRNKSGGKSAKKGELDLIRAKLDEQEQRLAAERKAIREEQERFEREKDVTLQSLRDQQEKLARRENELKRWESETPVTRYDETEPLIDAPLTSRERGDFSTFPPRHGPSVPAFQPMNHASDNSGLITGNIYGRDEIPMPKISFREALETVPTFDGQNLTVSQFARACRRAKEIIPPSSERNLTKLLCNKLRGRALTAVEDENCNTVAQLIDILSISFGEHRTLEQYEGELSNIHLRPKKHILDFINRVKDLRTSIIDCQRRIGKDSRIEQN